MHSIHFAPHHIHRFERPAWRNMPGVAGALAGLGGGVAMLGIAALLTYVLNIDLWLQLEIAAAPFFGAAATSGFALGPVLLGLGIHLSLAMLLGALFDLGMRRIARLSAGLVLPEIVGPIYGLLIWVSAFFVVLPLVSPLMLSISAASLLIQHLVYGATTGLLYALARP